MKTLPGEERTEARVLAGLARIGTVLRSQAWKEVAPRGVHPTQAQFLVFLARSRPDGARLTEMAERLAVTPATASESVSTLERKGLVERRPDPSDGRARLVVLTRAGRALAAEAESWPDLLLAVVEELDPDERRLLLRIVVKMIRGMQERGEISPSQMCVTCVHFRPGVHADPERPHHCAFVDAAFGDAELRLDCGDHEALDPEGAGRTWEAFVGSARRG